KALRDAGTLDVDYRVIWPDQSVHWLRVQGHAVYDIQGRPLRMAGISLDITDRKRTEESLRAEIAERRRVEKHQDLLLADPNHRARNTLAIVQSIAGQTLRHADSAAAFRTGFEARIMALSEAHRLLTDSNWEGARLSDIIDRVLNPYAAGATPRYTLTTDED